MQNRHHRYWLGLHLIPRFGSVKIAQLLTRFDSAEALWQERDENLRRLNLPRSMLEQFIAGRRSIDLSKEMDKVRRASAKLITLADESYPPLLRAISGCPPLLYVRGRLENADKCLAIVGTRKPSIYGRNAAYELAASLAQQRVTIVSGLAQGIDAAAHHGALKAGGTTVAVMATGIDRIYPQENTDLAAHIVEQGAIITEMPIGTAPLPQHFPRRNRIISGMSLGVLVAEAPEKSGALITVAAASEQGRDVFALPHNIFSKTGRGSNRLIQDGAKLVMAVSDVLEELDIAYLNTQVSIKTEQVQPTSSTEETILEQLDVEPVDVDTIVRKTQLPAATVTSTLALLELKGLAEIAGPMRYCRPRQPLT